MKEKELYAALESLSSSEKKMALDAVLSALVGQMSEAEKKDALRAVLTSQAEGVPLSSMVER